MRRLLPALLLFAGTCALVLLIFTTLPVLKIAAALLSVMIVVWLLGPWVILALFRVGSRGRVLRSRP